MTPQTETVIRHLMPDVLSIAGMEEHANALRALRPYEEESATLAFDVLEEVRIRAQTHNSRWGQHIADAASWGQGALMAAVENDMSAYEFCLLQIEKAMERAENSRYVH